MNPEDETVAALVAEALEHEDRTGTKADLGKLCAEHPTLRDAVVQVLEQATALKTMSFNGALGGVTAGQILEGRYRIEDRVGAGAMGVVFKATDLQLSRSVALKVLHSNILTQEATLLRFEREAEALAALRDDFVVTIFDRGATDEGAPFLVMELVEGVPLSAIVESARKLPSATTKSIAAVFDLAPLIELNLLRQMVVWCADLASGLQAAHDAGLVHRDVKPSNVMIRRDGRPLLIDFGAVANESLDRVTLTGGLMGTPAYMAPESLDAGYVPQPTTDVYGLTATLMHMVLGVAPYSGTPSQVLAALATGSRAVDLHRLPGLPADLRGILEMGLNRNPDDRYATAGELEADLRSFLAYEPVKARPTSPTMRAFKRVVRSPLLQGAAVVLALGLGAFGWRVHQEQQFKSREAASDTAYVHVPSCYGVLKYGNRRIPDAELALETSLVFDRMVSVRHQPVVARSLRASFRLDHGDPAGAASDMAALAARLGTPFSRELSHAYGALDRTASSAQALQLESLPEPRTAEDVYLAGFHEFRQLRYANGAEWFQDGRLDPLRHVQELRALFKTIAVGTAAKKSHSEGDQLAGELFEEVIRIEERFGSTSAMSAHLKGYALAIQGRYLDSLPLCEEGLELAPASSSTAINAARDAFRADKYDVADRWVQHAIQLLPHYDKAFETGFLTRMSRSEFQAAGDWLEATPFTESARDQRRKRSFAIQLGTHQALKSYLEGAKEEAAGHAAAVLKSFEKQGDSPAKADRDYALVCESVLHSDQMGIFREFARRQKEDSLSANQLKTLLRLTPETADLEVVHIQKEVLSAIADALLRRRKALAPVGE